MEAELKKCGVELVLGVKVESIEPGLKVNYAAVKDGAKGTAEGDVVLMAGGRIPTPRVSGLDTIGVKMDRKGFVDVDGLCPHQCPRRLRHWRHQRQDAAGPCGKPPRAPW